MVKKYLGAGLFAVVGLLVLAGVIYRNEDNPDAETPIVVDETKKKVVEFLELPSGWEKIDNEAKTKKLCYVVSVAKIGKMNVTFDSYLLQAYKGRNPVEILKGVQHSREGGVEFYRLPPLSEREASTIFVKPLERDWFRVIIYYLGPTEWQVPPPEVMCTKEETEVEIVLKNIKFL